VLRARSSTIPASRWPTGVSPTRSGRTTASSGRRSTRSTSRRRWRRRATRFSSGTTGSTLRAQARPRNKREAAQRLSAAAQSLGELLPAEELADLAVETELAVGGGGRESAGVPVLTGEALPARADVAAVHLRNLQRACLQRRQMLAETITVKEAAELLGIGRQSLHDRLKTASLLAVKDRGQWRFPLWQFDPEGPDGILDGLPETLRALQGPISDVGKVR
jgi:excisionase family DNA binding protein